MRAAGGAGGARARGRGRGQARVEGGSRAGDAKARCLATGCFRVLVPSKAAWAWPRGSWQRALPSGAQECPLEVLLRQNGALQAVGARLTLDTAPRSKQAKEIERLAFSKGGTARSTGPKRAERLVRGPLELGFGAECQPALQCGWHSLRAACRKSYSEPPRRALHEPEARGCSLGNTMFDTPPEKRITCYNVGKRPCDPPSPDSFGQIGRALISKGWTQHLTDVHCDRDRALAFHHFSVCAGFDLEVPFDKKIHTPQPDVRALNLLDAGEWDQAPPQQQQQQATVAEAPPPKSNLVPLDHLKAITSGREFCYDDFDLRATVGTGTFGRVRVVKIKGSKDRTPLALKIMKKSEVIRLKQVEHVKAETGILAQISHPFIVNLLAAFQDE
ncbi:unnamed protein product, partial [Prorocentrum cordatum]